MVALFFQSDLREQSYGRLNVLDTQGHFVVLITCINSKRVGLSVCDAIASKYAYNNLELRTGSPTCSVVTCVRSSASDQYSCRSH